MGLFYFIIITSCFIFLLNLVLAISLKPSQSVVFSFFSLLLLISGFFYISATLGEINELGYSELKEMVEEIAELEIENKKSFKDKFDNHMADGKITKLEMMEIESEYNNVKKLKIKSDLKN